MKRIIFLLLTAFSLTAGAQSYNNEWIDYSKTYYKFKIGSTGLYRISQPVLASIGIASSNADHFQLWRNGQEIPLYTSVQGAALGATDYIEFYGEMNDGKADLPLYREPDYQLSDRWSLQTDTAAFFLTVNPAGGNLRLVPTANNVSGTTLPVEPYFMYHLVNSFRSKINQGRSEVVGSSYTYSSSYDAGEGWTTDDIASGATRSYTFSNIRLYTGAGAPGPSLKVTAAGNAVNPRYFRIKLNGDSIYSQSMDYYDYAKATIPVTIAQLNKNLAATIEITNLCASAGDRMVASRFELIYPRQFNFGGFSNFFFELPANSAGNHLQIAGFTYGSVAPVLYDLTNGKRYVADISNPSILKVVLQPSAVDRKLVMVSEAATNIKEITSLQPRSFINYGQADKQGNYLLITNASLTGASGGNDPIEEYRAYRSSVQGGSYNAKVYLIDQLEDQFAYGIKQHPLSIRNFLRWARSNYSSPVKNVLIVGKGVIYSFFNSNQSNPDIDKLALVPTFGNPASDNLLTAEGNSSMPLTPIGRLSVVNKDEITVYLNKVKEYEQNQTTSSASIADKAWMKNVVHVTGASDNNTSDILLAALNGHKLIIEDTLYAANVSTFTKFSADAVEQVTSARLEALFKEGIGLLTYFGHSSASTLEFNLDNPNSYDNQGKYPVFIVMGCNAGSFYNFNTSRLTGKETISEKFVLAKDRGSIAFLASTHLGIVHYLDIYNSRNYRAMSSVKYGATLGEIMDEAISEVFDLTTEQDFYARFQCEQFTLHGDPAIRYYHFEKPDYVIEDQLVKVSPSIIQVSDSVFYMNVGFMNIGKAVTKDIIIEVKRTFPDGTPPAIQRDTIPFTSYFDSLTYKFDVISTRDKGLNKIAVTIDAGNQVDELYESNNTVTKDVYIIADDIKPVYPYNYSIVNRQDIKFAASSADPFAPSREYWMEIDTTEQFDSPLKVRKTINSIGGVFEFSPGISFTDSTVYYWRVATAVSGTTPPGWNSSSFQYVANGLKGFSQAHHHQFLHNKYNKIVYGDERKFKFSPRLYDISVASGIYPYAGQTNQFRLSIDGTIAQAGLYGPLNSNRNVLRFYVIDGKKFKPWKNVSVGSAGLYGSTNPTPINATVTPGFFQFDITDSAKRKNVMNFIDSIPEGDYLVITNSPYSSTVLPAVWMKDTTWLGSGNSLYHKIYNLGFTNLSSMTSYVPFVFAAQKGNPVAIRQVISPTISEDVHTSFVLTGANSDGSFMSENFGPAKSWGSLYWNGYSQEANSTDQIKMQVLGIKSNGLVDTLAFTNTPNEGIALNWVDAKIYPNIRLRMAATDDSNYTPYQLDYWMLTYDPVPEGAIAPNIYFKAKDSTGVGELVNFGVGFKNISNENFDSVRVKVVVTDKDNFANKIYDKRHKPLLPNDTIQLDVPIDTKLFAGKNTVFVDFNPDNDQPEQHLFNNYGFRNLYVRPDSLNPVMDVTFDGTHILNKDIVSAKPHILIKLSDDVKGMVLNDTSLITVKVRYPDGTLQPFYFSNTDTLQFLPANPGSGNENTATVNFKPYFLRDGEYELIVTGKDKSGNVAGRTDYRVSFTIINKPMISNMLNYPNPFTTSTAFVFTVTGSQVPQNIRIQVLTITGKIVREITKDELGPIRIGRNITEFKWDGTDQYGQKLANGVYLYRVITNLNGKALDKYKAQGDDTDKYFNKGYGKMYLMR